MPTWATGTSTGSRHLSGFTLLELLVVVFIIAILSGLVVLSTGLAGMERRLESEAATLAASLELASEQAVLTGKPIAVSFSERGWHFVELRNGNWISLRRGPLAQGRLLDPGTKISLELDGVEIDLADGDVLGKPHVILHSSGEITPFRVAMNAASESGVTVHPQDGSFRIDHGNENQ